MIHNETMNTSSTVPGQIVIRVLSTKRVLKLILLRAPMLRELASVNSLEWSSITLGEREREWLEQLNARREPCFHSLVSKWLHATRRNDEDATSLFLLGARALLVSHFSSHLMAAKWLPFRRHNCSVQTPKISKKISRYVFEYCILSQFYEYIYSASSERNLKIIKDL